MKANKSKPTSFQMFGRLHKRMQIVSESNWDRIINFIFKDDSFCGVYKRAEAISVCLNPNLSKAPEKFALWWIDKYLRIEKRREDYMPEKIIQISAYGYSATAEDGGSEGIFALSDKGNLFHAYWENGELIWNKMTLPDFEDE
jgi:hypothetical protein